MTNEDRKNTRQDILLTLKASDVHVTGELYFALLFASDNALRELCRLLHIKVSR